MTAITKPTDLLAVDRCVVYRRDVHARLADASIVEFGSHKAACVAVRLMRREDWLKQAELWLDDEDYLAIQVLARRIEKRVAGEKSSAQNRFFREVQNDKTGGVDSPSLEDLL